MTDVRTGSPAAMAGTAPSGGDWEVRRKERAQHRGGPQPHLMTSAWPPGSVAAWPGRWLAVNRAAADSWTELSGCMWPTRWTRWTPVYLAAIAVHLVAGLARGSHAPLLP